MRLDLRSSDHAVSLRLTNPADVPIGAEVRLFEWSQDADGKDQYAPSGDFAAVPSIFTIEPGRTQVVRMVRSQAPGTAERRYRVVVDELPQHVASHPGEMITRIRLVLPFFVDADRSLPASLQWQLSRDALTVANSGGRTARLTGLAVQGMEISNLAGIHYVQPGAKLRWPVSGAGCPKSVMHITGTVDDRPVDATLSQACS